jgi:hypothetical protein
MSIFYRIKGQDQVYRASSDIDMLHVYLRFGTSNIKIMSGITLPLSSYGTAIRYMTTMTYIAKSQGRIKKSNHFWTL